MSATEGDRPRAMYKVSHRQGPEEEEEVEEGFDKEGLVFGSRSSLAADHEAKSSRARPVTRPYTASCGPSVRT